MPLSDRPAHLSPPCGVRDERYYCGSGTHGTFFSAIAFAGRLYAGGILDSGPWDARTLVYWDETQVDAILNERVGDRKVRTPEELHGAVTVSRLHHPAVKVWIAEGLEEVAREVWQESSRA